MIERLTHTPTDALSIILVGIAASFVVILVMRFFVYLGRANSYYKGQRK